MSKEKCIEVLENYYMETIERLFDQDRQKDADSVYEEFVVDGENPTEWTFLEHLEPIRLDLEDDLHS